MDTSNNWGGTGSMRWTSIPSRGSNAPSRLMLHKLDKFRLRRYVDWLRKKFNRLYLTYLSHDKVTLLFIPKCHCYFPTNVFWQQRINVKRDSATSESMSSVTVQHPNQCQAWQCNIRINVKRYIRINVKRDSATSESMSSVTVQHLNQCQVWQCNIRINVKSDSATSESMSSLTVQQPKNTELGCKAAAQNL
jgi:hypothetical protein